MQLKQRILNLENNNASPDELLDEESCEQFQLDYGTVTVKQFQGWCRDAMNSTGGTIYDSVSYD